MILRVYIHVHWGSCNSECFLFLQLAIISPYAIIFQSVFKVIFGTGDALRVVTLTANEAFVRAATHQVTFDKELFECA